MLLLLVVEEGGYANGASCEMGRRATWPLPDLEVIWVCRRVKKVAQRGGKQGVDRKTKKEKGRSYHGDETDLIPQMILICLKHHDRVVIPLIL